MDENVTVPQLQPFDHQFIMMINNGMLTPDATQQIFRVRPDIAILLRGKHDFDNELSPSEIPPETPSKRSKNDFQTTQIRHQAKRPTPIVKKSILLLVTNFLT